MLKCLLCRKCQVTGTWKNILENKLTSRTTTGFKSCWISKAVLGSLVQLRYTERSFVEARGIRRIDQFLNKNVFNSLHFMGWIKTDDKRWCLTAKSLPRRGGKRYDLWLGSCVGIIPAFASDLKLAISSIRQHGLVNIICCEFDRRK